VIFSLIFSWQNAASGESFFLLQILLQKDLASSGAKSPEFFPIFFEIISG